MKALIVDDDRVLADVLAFTLRREGFQVLQAHDGAEALERWAEEQPDLVILDVALENRLLDYLVLNAGHVLTGEAIIDHVWGAEGGDRDMLRQLVHRLRSKLAQACQAAGSDPDRPPAQIETVPGLGYGLVVSAGPPDETPA
ncbi:MAG: winged helix-turn-helix domain-containing protein [Anaerolineae bacterium]